VIVRFVDIGGIIDDDVFIIFYEIRLVGKKKIFQ
jgi:hypothetical protein